MPDEQKTESLETEVEQILEEARMVLPGIQALFGFQLIAVFNQRFDEALERSREVFTLGRLGADRDSGRAHHGARGIS